MKETLIKLYEMTSFGGFIDDPGAILMLIIGGVLLYLGIVKKFEPLLLIPIGFGVLLANIPGAEMSVVASTEDNGIMHLSLVEIAKQYGIINLLYYALIKSGLLPPLIFMGVGAMTDFGPMLRNLRLAFFGGAAQLGIFTVLVFSIMIGFTPQEAGALSIIGGADGPTAIYTTIKLAPHLLGPIAIAAYSYMALVPFIIPMVANRLITKEEFLINMKSQDQRHPTIPIKHLQKVKIIFPIALFLVVGVLVPSSVPLLGALLFGNLVKEIGAVTDRLSKAASSTIMNTSTIFLGLCVGATMNSASFLQKETLMILVGGFIAFSISVLGGICAVKIFNLFTKKKINPLIGATGLSAVPMASRVANDLALKHDPKNHILQYAMASNISGVIGSAVAAGVLISFLG
ncbi:sodium ion-translocating decarboxylase subunit beta [Flammeovirga yaeyamensis]|uniref:Sodium ion-translocating decarboxylase subunit beta n=1 Tax=Flammeovirga yaeyamensis TaxID=367791 RepID=A0AAX1N6X6_9BACT|nr:sodium ion-translocating decarboxylase subunit beta [Flammeovirga yaeyamensis]MBB3701543.1 oxaloacetate decarboxylase beta subunit [Flammeovirga yaeyamensis]NMF38687.1 sodium ion-translocating decarboxylase subunit beta [Flammeovirga yaeyamensis]QWG01553.1 sodium ion-translocating decarboxylase subunit beta [Flammeovirga yaeyamensis]